MQPMPLFNKANSLSEALNAIKQSVPAHQRNDITALVMSYHNTLIAQINSNTQVRT